MYKDPKELLIILNNTLKRNNIEMTLGFIIGMLENANVYIKEDEIKKYLDKEKNRFIKNKDLTKMNSGEVLLYKMSLKKYDYIPYTLKYYKKTILILKKKCLKFIRLIDSILDKDITKKTLEQYDISINDNGYILDSDIKRIVEPFVYNLYLLIQVINDANNLETYIKNKIDLDMVYSHNYDEESIYPSEDLQKYDFENTIYGDKGFIPFTAKQEVENENKKIEYLNKTMVEVDKFFPDLIYQESNKVKRS